MWIERTLRFAVLTTLGCMFWRETDVSFPWLVPSRRPLRAFSVAISEFEYTVTVSESGNEFE